MKQREMRPLDRLRTQFEGRAAAQTEWTVSFLICGHAMYTYRNEMLGIKQIHLRDILAPRSSWCKMKESCTQSKLLRIPPFWLKNPGVMSLEPSQAETAEGRACPLWSHAHGNPGCIQRIVKRKADCPTWCLAKTPRNAAFWCVRACTKNSDRSPCTVMQPGPRHASFAYISSVLAQKIIPVRHIRCRYFHFVAV